MWKRNCPKCGKELTYTQKHNFTKAEKNQSKCYECRDVKKKGKVVNCAWCGKTKYIRPSYVEEGRRYFCSVGCQHKFASKYQSGENSKLWKHGKEKRRKRYREFVNKRRIENKIKALKLLGGKCVVCGYDKCIGAFDFHHTDPTIKDVDVCKLLGRVNWDSKLEKELEKCVLLCSNCHRETHWKERQNDKRL